AGEREALDEFRCHQRTSLLSDFSTMLAEDEAQVCDSSASMYIRFVIQRRDAASAKRKGLFQALVGLRDSGEAGAEELSRIDILFKWFNKHLAVPQRFAKSRRPHGKKVALSWYKATAVEHIRKMHEMAALLDAHGIAVDILSTDRPGYVVYEDDHQIVAEP